MKMFQILSMLPFRGPFRLVLVLIASLAYQAAGWGMIGHEMVANLAYNRLSVDSQDSVKRILKGYNHTDDKDAGSPLAAVANWADKVRFTKSFHWTMRLHFIDVQDTSIAGGCPCEEPGTESESCRFEYTRDCEGDQCVAGAILNYTIHLERTWNQRRQREDAKFLRGVASTSDDELIRESLMFLTHFVGDIHQPLHSSRASDKGGNTFHVHFDQKMDLPILLRSGSHAHHWNLHSIWDDAIIEKAMTLTYNHSRERFEGDLTHLIQQAGQTGQLTKWLACSDGGNKTCVSTWAEESLDDALAWAYRNVDGREVVNGTTLGDEYYRSRLPVVQRRLAAAGVRLAATLEAALGGNRTEVVMSVA